MSALSPANLTKGKSYVYFLQCHDSIKIGFTTNIEQRLHDLGNQIPPHIPTRLFALAEGDQKMERALHRRFELESIRGEWYPLSELFGFLTEEFFANRLVYFAPVFDVEPDPYLIAQEK